jgi:hypothetical protein
MAGSITNHGTDIRFDTCTNIAFEQLPRAAVVMVDKRAMLARPTKPDSTKYKLSTASKLKPAGFEFRMFDHFPSAVAHELVATVVTLSALTYTKSNLSKVMDVQTHREWYNKWVCLHCMEVEDRLTQRIGLVSGKRWACAPLKSRYMLCRTDADEGRLHSLYGCDRCETLSQEIRSISSRRIPRR